MKLLKPTKMAKKSDGFIGKVYEMAYTDCGPKRYSFLSDFDILITSAQGVEKGISHKEDEAE
ncbi:hypothetical protein FSC10_13070 [Acinetobacter schindleri]|uniref:Uncharacterized protein n=1 Tax=Acinetobacter schindleri TaxID=108981 RepID=A0AAE7BYE3_9GAMM|nr:hypothetical protein FSC10_13070 [Acinetobacter schindleri]